MEHPDGDTFSHHGRMWNVTDSPALPKPFQAGGPPIIVGGTGKTRTPALAARYAAEFNLPFTDVDTFTRQCANVAGACEAIDRDPSTMVWSAALVLCCGSDEAEFARRAEAIGRAPTSCAPTALRARWTRWSPRCAVGATPAPHACISRSWT